MYQHFTKYHTYEALIDNNEYVVVVNKKGTDYCMFVSEKLGWPLSRALEHLDYEEDSGWLKDEEVGAHIATYSITTHPELFI